MVMSVGIWILPRIFFLKLNWLDSLFIILQYKQRKQNALHNYKCLSSLYVHQGILEIASLVRQLTSYHLYFMVYSCKTLVIHLPFHSPNPHYPLYTSIIFCLFLQSWQDTVPYTELLVATIITKVVKNNYDEKCVCIHLLVYVYVWL